MLKLSPEMKALAAAGRKYARAQKARDEARDDLLERIRDARRAGHSPTNEIIPAAGVARQTRSGTSPSSSSPTAARRP